MGRADEPELHSLLKEEGGDSAGSPRRDTKHDASSSPSQGPSPPYRAKCWEEGHLLMQNQMKHCEGEIPAPFPLYRKSAGPCRRAVQYQGRPWPWKAAAVGQEKKLLSSGWWAVLKETERDFACGPVVKNSSASAMDTGLIPGLGTEGLPWELRL